MNEGLIKNFDELATTPNRKITLQIMESGLNAINTEKVVDSSVSVVGNILFVKGKPFNLVKHKNIKVVGFGKSSCEAARPVAASAIVCGGRARTSVPT